MAKRDNHYEAAFEAYLRERHVAYVAVDEAKRAKMSDGSLKSLDFIVSRTESNEVASENLGIAESPRESGGSWLIDVKGRRFPSGRSKQYWKNWSTRDDLRSLARWQRLFGDQSVSLFVFAYHILGNRSPLPAEQLFRFRDSLYGFVGIELAGYLRWARPLSKKWDTVTMPTAAFRQLAAPLHRFF